jgi:fibronectin type 3 domain-containing protein
MRRLLAAQALSLLLIAQTHADDAREAIITFTRPTRYVDGTPINSQTAITYRLYQGKRSEQKALVAEINTTSVTVNTGLPPGETCWEVTAVANGVESARSNEACKSFPYPAPQAVTITVR